jgi:cell fate (sporulation/competence/biofilm development) regulator YlbF (YheA/YmcA/DUF963 family)
MTDIIMKAYDVRDMYANHPLLEEMRALDAIIRQEHSVAIGNFKTAKDAYNDVMESGGIHHPSYKDAARALKQAKETLFSVPEVRRYHALERELQDDLDAFIRAFTTLISDHVPTDGPLGIMSKGGSCHVGQ